MYKWYTTRETRKKIWKCSHLYYILLTFRQFNINYLRKYSEIWISTI